MNKVVLIGRLTKEPELRYTPGSGAAVTSFTLAVDKYNKSTGQKEADFIPIVVWGKTAENCANYLSKGSQCAISGRLQTRSYDAKDGTKRYVTEVVADAFGGVTFLGSKNNNGSNAGSNTGGYSAPQGGGNDPFGGNFDGDLTPVDDGDLPF